MLVVARPRVRIEKHRIFNALKIKKGFLFVKLLMHLFKQFSIISAGLWVPNQEVKVP